MEIVTIDKSDYQKYKDQLLELYLECFSTGKSAQKLDPVKTEKYLESLFKDGYGIFFLEEEILTAVLLATPLGFDELIPEKIRQNFLLDNCVYIAEMMVTENARGRGLGKQLLEEFIQKVDKIKFKHAFIRVWVENVPAVTLYRKMGYEDYATIYQKKSSPDTGKTFMMHKVYLYKNLE